MKNKFKYLTKNFGLFLISSFFPKLVNFFMIPLYTAFLTTKDYGYSDLINTTVSLLIPIFTLDIQDAVLRFSMDKKIDEKDVISNALKINFIGFILVSCITILLSITRTINLPTYFYIFLIFNYLFTALYNSLTLFCKGVDKVKVIVIATVINSITILAGNLIFLIYLKIGVVGYLLANLLGMIISVMFIVFKGKIYKYIKINSSKEILKEMIRYSFPLIFSVVAWWINSASDRYILSWISGVAISGVYAISYKIPSILTAFSGALYNAWSISSIKDFDENDMDGFIGNTYTLLNFSLCFLCSMIMILNVLIAHFLYSNSFFEAWKFVPPLLISVVYNSISLFIGGIFTAVKDTKLLSKSTIIGAIINTIMNFILIYYFSAYGAAIATMLGYFTVLLIRFIFVQKYIKMKTNNIKNFAAYFVLTIQMVFAFFGNKYIFIEIPCAFIILYIYHDSIFKVIDLVKKKFFIKIKQNQS